MNINNELENISKNICCHPNFGTIIDTYITELWNVYVSDPRFYVILFKESRITTFHTLLVLIFNHEKISLSDFYNYCAKNKISSRNNTITLVEFLVHTKRLETLKTSDRRKKQLYLTCRGKDNLSEVINISICALKFLDSELLSDFKGMDDLFIKYYRQTEMPPLHGSLSQANNNFIKSVIDKTGGIPFICKIYLDVKRGHIKLNEPVKGTYFSGMSDTFGSSPSQILNLLKNLVTNGYLSRSGRAYVVRKELICAVINFSVIYLARSYFFIKR